MSLTSIQINEHIETILNSRRIKNKIVILCEGDIQTIQGRASPQAYRQLEKWPDANFYKACIPKWWTQNQPTFFNCGSRQDVLNTYFGLLAHHEQDPTNSYLSPNKLFALVDLDLQAQKLEASYPFDDTEAIFADLYKHAEVNEANISKHQIWVTGFIHKEAYYFLPTLQTIFDSHTIPPIFQNKPLTLETIYLAMAQSIERDPDLKNNFSTACARIDFCKSLACSDPATLKESWQGHFRDNPDKGHKDMLIASLLMIVKAKPFWHQVTPKQDAGWTNSDSVYQDQLRLKIGRFIAALEDTSKHHLYVFFKRLYHFV